MEVIEKNLAFIGLNALIDEATGHQQDRASDALLKMALEKNCTEETWVAFISECTRLMEKSGRKAHLYRGKILHKMIDDIVFSRLRGDTIETHLARVTALLRASANWSQFMRLLERALPKCQGAENIQ